MSVFGLLELGAERIEGGGLVVGLGAEVTLLLDLAAEDGALVSQGIGAVAEPLDLSREGIKGELFVGYWVRLIVIVVVGSSSFLVGIFALLPFPVASAVFIGEDSIP